MDAELSSKLCCSDTYAYTTANQIAEFKKLVSGNLEKEKGRQKQNHDKGRRDRVWVRTHTYSKADKSFSSKLAPWWKGPYWVTSKICPLNFEVVLEDTAEDPCVFNVAQLKPCYATAEETDREERCRILEIFEEENSKEDFLGSPASGMGEESIIKKRKIYILKKKKKPS